MKLVILLFIFMIPLSGCGSAHDVNEDDLSQYEVQQTFDEVTEDKFTFQLVSSKEEYMPGEEVELYGEIIYTGEKESISIHHSSSAVLFSLEEQIRAYEISLPVMEIAMKTELIPDQPHKEIFKKGNVQQTEEEAAYRNFIEKFKSETGFPPGYYILTATASFYDGSVQRDMTAQIDFKVLAE